MILTYKVMLVPNNKQRTKLFQYAGAARFAYNWALGREKESHEAGGGFVSGFDLRKMFTLLRHSEGYEWLMSVSNNVTKQAIKDACTAFGNFFSHRAAFPKFKSRKRSRPSFFQDPVKFKVTDTHVKVEGFATSRKANKQKLNWIRLAERGRIPPNAKYYNPRFTFDGLNWWISVGVEAVVETECPTSEGVGIDLGVKDLAVCSDGTTYTNINRTDTVRKLEKKRRRLQRGISRKYEMNKKGGGYCKTKNATKSERKLLRVCHRLTNVRKDHVHKATTEITGRKPSFVVVEDLNVSGMMKNRHLARAVQEQGLREFRRQLEYKCEWHGIRLVVADRWYPSSKTCCRCGHVKKDLKLSERTFRCDECGNVIDRDFQAALNLKVYAATA